MNPQTQQNPQQPAAAPPPPTTGVPPASASGAGASPQPPPTQSMPTPAVKASPLFERHPGKTPAYALPHTQTYQGRKQHQAQQAAVQAPKSPSQAEQSASAMAAKLAAHQSATTPKKPSKDLYGVGSIICVILFPPIGLIMGVLGWRSANKLGRDPVFSKLGTLINAVMNIVILIVLVFGVNFVARVNDDLGTESPFTISNITNSDEQLSQEEAQAVVDTFVEFIEDYYIENGIYPQSLDILPDEVAREASVRRFASGEGIYLYLPEVCDATGGCQSFTATYLGEGSSGEGSYSVGSEN